MLNFGGDFSTENPSTTATRTRWLLTSLLTHTHNYVHACQAPSEMSSWYLKIAHCSSDSHSPIHFHRQNRNHTKYRFSQLVNDPFSESRVSQHNADVKGKPSFTLRCLLSSYASLQFKLILMSFVHCTVLLNTNSSSITKSQPMQPETNSFK